MNTYTEKQAWGTTSYIILSNSYTHLQTKRAQIDLITNPHFGRMLFIDGVLQSSTADEQLYHKPLVKAAMGYRPCTKILVAGGAEGATIREIQNHDSSYNLGVKDIIMVDWDEELVEHMKEKEPWSQGSFDDPRLELLYKDFEEYIEKCNKKFDTIILDLLDPNTEDEVSWLKKQIYTSSLALERNGRLTVNCGSKIKNVEDIKEFIKKNIHITEIDIQTIYVPSFMEVWYILTFQA